MTKSLIIGGLPRSGTTMLNRILNSNKEIALTTEFGVFLYLKQSLPTYLHKIAARPFEIRKGFPFESGKIIPNPSHIFFHNIRMTTRYLIQYSWLQLCENKKRGNSRVKNVGISLSRLYPGASIVGDKYPDYVFHIENILETSKINCLIIYRDCRDVTASILEMVRSAWNDKLWVEKFSTARKIALHWRKAINEMERFSNLIHTVQYEALVQQPREEVKRISDWLGISNDNFDFSIPKPGSIGKYRERLSLKELRDVMDVAGQTMKNLCYC